MQDPTEHCHRLCGGNTAVGGHCRRAGAFENAIAVGLVQSFLCPMSLHVGEIREGGAGGCSHAYCHGGRQKQGKELSGSFHYFILPDFG